MVIYDDDEKVIDDHTIQDKVKARYFNKKDAPLKSVNYKVVVELTGAEAGKDRPGVDIIFVLDMGLTTRGKFLKQIKIATKFVIKKLSPLDRLSVVKFSLEAHRLCPLKKMTPNAKSYIEGLVDKLQTDDKGANITAALEMAVQVLDDRRFKEGREVAIMLVSDAKEHPHKYDGSQVHIKKIPVYTFGFGEDYHHPQVVQSISEGSKGGGTFSTADVKNTESISSLSIAFSQCLAGLLTVVVQELTLKITKKNSVIHKVDVGSYYLTPPDNDSDEGSVTFSFGNLYSNEVRNILVDLVLDEVNQPNGTQVLEFTYSYIIPGWKKSYVAPPVLIFVERVEDPTTPERQEVLAEEARQHTVIKMKEARELADCKKFLDAKNKLNKAKTNLERDELDKTNSKIIAIQCEVNKFLELMRNQQSYEKLGRAFALAAELSHALQRFAARGDVNKLRLFATPTMDRFLDQAKEYEKNPENLVIDD